MSSEYLAPVITAIGIFLIGLITGGGSIMLKLMLELRKELLDCREESASARAATDMRYTELDRRCLSDRVRHENQVRHLEIKLEEVWQRIGRRLTDQPMP